jgi:hypothetical protein
MANVPAVRRAALDALASIPFEKYNIQDPELGFSLTPDMSPFR